MAQEEERPHTVFVAVREWWNPAGHLVSTARAFDPVSGRVAWTRVDGHGNAAVAHAVREMFAQFRYELPETAGFVFDVVRVGKRRDLHTDPATVGLSHVTAMSRVSWGTL